MSKGKKRKRGPPLSLNAKTADHRQSSTQSPAAVESSGGLRRGETSVAGGLRPPSNSDERLVMLYVCVTLVHATALWAAIKIVPNLGIEVAGVLTHFICDGLDRIREGLFYIHAYSAAKTWWASS